LLLSIALMFPLVARYGLLGAALATFATEAIGLLVAVYLTRHAFQLPFDINRLGGVAASAAVMAMAIIMTRHEVSGTGFYALAAVSLAGGAAYVAAAWLFNVARIRTLSMRFLRPDVFRNTLLDNKGEL